MNKNNAKDYLPLVQALADGKVIQINGVRGWEDTRGDLIFGANPHDYRIKPEPREWWQLRDANCVRAEFTSRELAERYANGIPGNVWTVIHVREVLPQ